jgi:plastocyanin
MPNDPYCTPGSTPGQTYQRTFNTAGTYTYHCSFHGAQGMTGTITVTP